MLMTTTPSMEDAQRIARLLVEEKLAACVQLMPIQSFYHWKDKTQQDNETLLLIKTRKALFEARSPASRTCIATRCPRSWAPNWWPASRAISTGSTKSPNEHPGGAGGAATGALR